MATDEYRKLIKQEVESADDEKDSNISEEKCDALKVIISKNEFEPGQIKSEDGIDIVHHDLKSERCLEGEEGGPLCEVCGGSLLIPSDFFNPDGWKSCCICQGQNGSDAMQNEEMTRDLKQPSFYSDSKLILFETQEETFFGKEEEVIHENKLSCEIKVEKQHKTEDTNEIISSGCYLNSIRGTGEKITSTNLNERTNAKSVENKHTLKIHEKIHTREITFQCKICSKSFTRKSGLNRHKKIHSGVKPFQCNICSKSYIQINDLNRHEKIHTGDKPFRCGICSKSFIRSSDLKSHEKIHIGEKPFQCKICSKSFIQRGNLKAHENIHIGEKPFQCEICSKSFFRNSNLKRHEKIHAGE
nr:zinc finger protein OZF-like [Leptinotarsa decemlineata]